MKLSQLKRLGIIGTGQLSRMLTQAAHQLGVEVYLCHDSGKDHHPQFAPCLSSEAFGQADFLSTLDVLTYEHEHVAPSLLNQLAQNQTIQPSARFLMIMQDRLKQKQYLQTLSLPVVPFTEVQTKEDICRFADRYGWPLLLKSRKSGYDGKGQCWLDGPQAIDPLDKLPFAIADAILEAKCAFSEEVSLIGVRNTHGEQAFYDLCINYHRDGILRHNHNAPSHPLLTQAVAMMNEIQAESHYVGVLCIEFFVQNNQLVINEIAPRVHNSGHWTIEGAVTSQFENHIRAIFGWPLGRCDSIDHVQMINIIHEFPAMELLLNIPSAHVHHYQKIAQPNRKLGHITLVGNKQPLPTILQELMQG